MMDVIVSPSVSPFSCVQGWKKAAGDKYKREKTAPFYRLRNGQERVCRVAPSPLTFYGEGLDDYGAPEDKILENLDDKGGTNISEKPKKVKYM